MNQLRAADLLRRAADALQSESASASDRSGEKERPENARSVAQTVRGLFSPYSRPMLRNTGTRKTKGGHVGGPQWVHRFCCLSQSAQDYVPTREDRGELVKVGLGEKRITFRKNKSPESFKNNILEAYPLLVQGGGFEVMRTATGNRTSLVPIWIPPGGIHTQYLADESGLGQALCYIRPIQRDIVIEELPMNTDNDVKERCLSCDELVPMNQLRQHLLECDKADHEFDDEMPRMKKPKKKEYDIDDLADDKPRCSSNDISSSICPVCSLNFPAGQLEVHASTFVDVQAQINSSKLASTFTEALGQCFDLDTEDIFW